MNLVGLLVTYRRPRELGEMLSALGSQTRHLDHLIVVDNDHDVNVRHAVESANGVVSSTHYLGMPDNLGPAGAIAAGMMYLLDEQPDDAWIVILDDDDPPPTVESFARIEELVLTASLDPAVAAVGLVGARLDSGRGTLVRLADGELCGEVDVDYIGGGQLLTISMRAIRRVGVFRSEFFFGFDDLEFGLRLRAAGHRLVIDGDALRARRMAMAAGHKPPAPGWRRYYSVRNMVVVLREHGHIRGAAQASIRGIAGALGNRRPRSAATRSSEVWFALRGAADGWRGRLGRTVLPEAGQR